jgi:lipid-A-disaccharide synthase-like uncharacterized protein
VDWTDDPRWLAAGLLGNAVFFSRFLVQWLASERAGISYVPRVFWHLSLIGSAFLLAYALHRRDPIFVLAYLPNGFVYLRNLALLRRTGAIASSSGVVAASEARGQQALEPDRLARHGPS